MADSGHGMPHHMPGPVSPVAHPGQGCRSRSRALHGLVLELCGEGVWEGLVPIMRRGAEIKGDGYVPNDNKHLKISGKYATTRGSSDSQAHLLFIFPRLCMGAAVEFLRLYLRTPVFLSTPIPMNRCEETKGNRSECMKNSGKKRAFLFF